MSSKNTRKKISSRPSLIPRKINTKVSSPSTAPGPKCNDKGKKKESCHQGVQETFYQLKEKLKSRYQDTTDKKELKKAQEKETVITRDPPSLQLPPPTKEFYDTSFLDFVSDIIHKHQQEEYKINTNSDDLKLEIDNEDDDESRVEKPRREADPTKQVTGSNLPIESPINLLEPGNEEQLVEFELDFDSIVIDCLEEEREESNDLKMIDQSDLLNAEDNKGENNTCKGLVELSEFRESFLNNDFSWLCFDSKDEFVRFKDDCEKKGFGALVEESNTNDSMLEMERVLLEGGYMSPIRLDKTKPVYYKSVPKIIETSTNEIEKKDLGNQNKDGTSSNQTKANNKNEEAITRVTLEENVVNNYKDNSSSINIEKHILRSSTPIKAINVPSNRASDKEVPSEDSFDYYADCRDSVHSYKRKHIRFKEENDESILRRTPPLIKFPPRKRRTF
ncbi:hypothetical protein BDF21DRAFT_400500 [Thamnidium elegans]|nr:hypothetical protein BDF21DRAFT_400500 [Thamnidium elegans]